MSDFEYEVCSTEPGRTFLRTSRTVEGGVCLSRDLEGSNTLFQNFNAVVAMMDRDDNHVYYFIQNELGTSASRDGPRVRFKGRIPQAHSPHHRELREHVHQVQPVRRSRHPFHQGRPHNASEVSGVVPRGRSNSDQRRCSAKAAASTSSAGPPRCFWIDHCARVFLAPVEATRFLNPDVYQGPSLSQSASAPS